MKKFILIVFLFSFSLSANAYDNYEIANEINYQKQIDNIGTQILNANKIEKRIVFAYDKEDSENYFNDPAITKRQVVLYDKYIKYIENDDELAGFLARGISIAARSFDGIFKGALRSLQIKASPKKFEIVADKEAVDLMVNAGYNPVALITFIQKSSPQKRFDKISNKNLTSKRLAIIYEYIYTKYPYYLANNEYLHTESYQNFLLTSIDNRKKLEEKIKSGSTKGINYE